MQSSTAEPGKEGMLWDLGPSPCPSTAPSPGTQCPPALIILGTLEGCVTSVLEKRRMGYSTLSLEDLCPSVASTNV